MEKLEPLWIVGRNAKWYSHCGRQFASSYDPAIALLIKLPKGVEIFVHTKACTHKKPVYNRFILNCQILEATKMLFSRWMDKLWYMQTMEYYSALRRNELLSHEKTWRNLKCILLTEISQSERLYIPYHSNIWHPRKGKTTETVKSSLVSRGW